MIGAPGALNGWERHTGIFGNCRRPRIRPHRTRGIATRAARRLPRSGAHLHQQRRISRCMDSDSTRSGIIVRRRKGGGRLAPAKKDPGIGRRPRPSCHRCCVDQRCGAAIVFRKRNSYRRSSANTGFAAIKWRPSFRPVTGSVSGRSVKGKTSVGRCVGMDGRRAGPATDIETAAPRPATWAMMPSNTFGSFIPAEAVGCDRKAGNAHQQSAAAMAHFTGRSASPYLRKEIARNGGHTKPGWSGSERCKPIHRTARPESDLVTMSGHFRCATGRGTVWRGPSTRSDRERQRGVVGIEHRIRLVIAVGQSG